MNKNKQKIRLILWTMLFLVFWACPLWAQKSLYRHDAQFPFIVITADTVNVAPKFTDEEFYKNSSGVMFEIGKSLIPVTDKFYNTYRDEVLPMINRRHLQLRKVYVRGAASPDGPYPGNQRLGLDRSNSLLSMLRNDLAHQYLDLDAQVNSITEDYGYLCFLMEAANDPDYTFVKSIYDQSKGNEIFCKRKLMAAQKGALWKRLNEKYFPKLRTARVMLWFSEPDKAHAPEKEIILPPNTGGITSIKKQSSRKDTLFLTDTVVVSKTTVIDKKDTVIIRNGTFVNVPTDTLTKEDNDTIFHHPLFAVKTNLLFDAATLLNGEVEVPIGNRFSLMGEVIWPWWLDKKHNKWCVEMGNVGLEARYWFKKWKRHNTFKKWESENNAPLHGWFIGAYAHGGYYDFQLKRREGSQGEFVGGGLSIGYTSYIGRHWRLELSLAGGIAQYKDREYYIEDNTPSDPDREQHLWKDGEEKKSKWIGPTKAKVSLAYVITRKCKKGGKK